MNTKTIKRMAIIITSMCVLLIMAAPVFADANDMNGKGAGYYMVEDETIPTYSTTDQVKVRVIVQGRYSTGNNPVAAEAKRTVTLTGKTSYTVRDVLIQFNSDSATYKAYDYDGLLMSNTSTVVASFRWGTRTWGSLFWYDILNIGERIYVDGWMFRVNGKYPMLYATNPSNPPVGAMIYDTPVKAGDVVTFFYNLPFTINNTDYSTYFIAADTQYTPSSDPNGTGTLEVQLQSSRDNHYDTNQNGAWTISPFTNYAPGSSKNVTIYNSSFNSISSGLNLTVDSSGYGSFNIDLNPGVYYIEVPTKTFKSITGYSAKTGTATITCNCLDTTFVYDRFEVPTPTPAS
jgi:hypothetical protein